MSQVTKAMITRSAGDTQQVAGSDSTQPRVYMERKIVIIKGMDDMKQVQGDD